jgi:prolyl oligopeptidase
MTPPRTRREAVADTLHGIAVPDPYRWLESGDDPQVQQWVADQNRHTRSALDAIPERGIWHERLVALMGLPVVQGVQMRGELMFLLERGAGAQQARLVVRPVRDPSSSVMVLADPAAGSADAATAVDWFLASPDGSLVVFGVSEGGTENSLLRVVRSSDGSLLDDQIPNCRACSVQWEPDASGFVYTRYPEGDEYHRTVHHHALGQPWVDDPVVWNDFPTPETWPEVKLSPEGRFLLVEALVGWGRTDLHLLDRQTGVWRDVLMGVEAQNDFTFADESTLIGSTTLDAPRRRVVTVDVLADDVGPEAWRTVVPESEAVLGVPAPVPGGFYLGSTLVAVDRLDFVGDDGSVQHIEGLGVCTLAQVAVDRRNGAAAALVMGFNEPISR